MYQEIIEDLKEAAGDFVAEELAYKYAERKTLVNSVAEWFFGKGAGNSFRLLLLFNSGFLQKLLKSIIKSIANS